MISRDETTDDAFTEVLRAQHPTREQAAAEIGRLALELQLPAETVHVISDVHGEDVKLRHVINNASGRLRPIVERRFAGRCSPEEMRELLTLIFYPQETLTHLHRGSQDPRLTRTLFDLFELMQ